jgi:AcrR family transcriptional regulator
MRPYARCAKMATVSSSQAQPSVRDELVRAAVDLLNADGPDALQTRRIASAAGTSTMAVYTHFGGMQALIAEVAEEGLRQFADELTIRPTPDPVADLIATGISYRRYAIERPHMYRLMFGSTSAHGIKAPAHNVLHLTVDEISEHYPSFARVVQPVQRSIQAGRITAGAQDDAAVVAVAARFWAAIHGFVMLEMAGYYGRDGGAVGPVLAGMTTDLLVALGDSREQVERSQRSALSETPGRMPAPGVDARS